MTHKGGYTMAIPRTKEPRQVKFTKKKAQEFFTLLLGKCPPFEDAPNDKNDRFYVTNRRFSAMASGAWTARTGEMVYDAWVTRSNGWSFEKGGMYWVDRIRVHIAIRGHVIGSALYNFESLERDYDAENAEEEQERKRQHDEDMDNYKDFFERKFREEGRLKW
jgi:hypothetical protein